MRVDLPNTAIHLTGHDGARHSRNPFRIRGLSRKIHHLVGDDMGAPPERRRCSETRTRFGKQRSQPERLPFTTTGCPTGDG